MSSIVPRVEMPVAVLDDIAQVRHRVTLSSCVSGWPLGQRLLVVHVEAGMGDGAAFSAAIRAASSTIGPREVFTRIAVFFILARSAAPIRPRVRSDSTRWI